MTGKGDVHSEDILFPKPNFYEEKLQEARKLPTEDLAKALSLQEGDIGVVIMQKREEGGYVTTIALIKQEILMRQERFKSPKLTHLELLLLEALKRFMEASKRG